MDYEHNIQHNELTQMIAGRPDNPEPQPIMKESFTSKSKSRKSSSNSADDQLLQHYQKQATLRSELAEMEGLNSDLMKLGGTSAFEWTKRTDNSGQQNGESSLTIDQPSMIAENQDRHQQRHEQGQVQQTEHNQQSKGITELSSNVYVQDQLGSDVKRFVGDQTEEHQVYREGSNIVGEPIEKRQKSVSEKAPHTESDSDQPMKDQKSVQKSLQKSQQKSLQKPQEQKPLQQEHISNSQWQNQLNRPQQLAEQTDHHPRKSNSQDASHNEKVEQRDNAKFMEAEPFAVQPQVPTDHNKKSFDMSLEPEGRPTETEHLAHTQHAQPQLLQESLSHNNVPSNNSQPLSAVANSSQSNVDISQPLPPSYFTSSTGLPKHEESSEVSLQKNIEPKEHNKQELLRNEVDDPSKQSYIRMSNSPKRNGKKEQSKGGYSEPCKCSVM